MVKKPATRRAQAASDLASRGARQERFENEQWPDDGPRDRALKWHDFAKVAADYALQMYYAPKRDHRRIINEMRSSLLPRKKRGPRKKQSHSPKVWLAMVDRIKRKMIEAGGPALTDRQALERLEAVDPSGVSIKTLCNTVADERSNARRRK